MKTIRLQNFRSLVDTGPIEIRPISIFLGQNSSGKSTLIRSLPLLKQGLGVRTQGPFLWLGQLVDFGSFEETLSSFSNETCISVEFSFDAPLDAALNAYARNVPQRTELVNIRISELRTESGLSPCFEFRVSFDGHFIEFQIEENKFTYFSINTTDYTKLIKGRTDVKQWIGPIPTFGMIAGENQLLPNTSPSFLNEIMTILRSLSHGKTATERLVELRRVLVNSPLHLLLHTIHRTSYGDTQWQKNTKNWTHESAAFIRIRELIVGARFSQTMAVLSDYLTSFLYNTRYIKPLRASAERYYRKQGLAVDELDPEGDNFALFLHNMNSSEKMSFRDWSEKYFGIWIDVVESAGHLSLVLNSKKSPAQNFNMADAGFGYSQMFPILAQLWAIRRPSRVRSASRRATLPFVFSIEQPELHLHPRLQAKLADVFVSAISAAKDLGIDLRLMIETHSEYLVNRLGSLIANNALSHGDVAISVFEKEGPASATTMRLATFSDRGFLENWPFGFFEPTAD